MSREFRVGLMFVLSLAMLGLTLFYLGSFRKAVQFQVKFAKVNGLATDSPVHFNGVPIGRVTRIALSEEPSSGSDVPILVTLAVDRSARQHIRTSTTADIRSIGVLGDKYVLLLTPDYGTDLLDEDGFIQPEKKNLDVDKLLEQGTDFVSDASQITKDLKSVLDRLAHGDGVLQRLIGDKEMAEQFKTTVTQTLQQIEKNENLLALVLKDPEFAGQMKQGITQTMTGVQQLVETYRQGEGLVPALMTDQAFKTEVQGKITKLLDDSQTYMTRLSQSRGLLYRLLEDEAYGERISQNIDKATYHLASILEKIDEGDGTASLVINDPSLYKGLYEVVYGLEHSGISKWYIQKKRKKGSKILEKESKKGEGGSP